MEIIKVKPMPGLVIVLPLEIKAKETRGISNIIALDSKPRDFGDVEEIFDEHPFQAKVVSVGEPFNGILIDLQEGDHVYLTRELTQRDACLINGKVCAFIRQSDIICKLI